MSGAALLVCMSIFNVGNPLERLERVLTRDLLVTCFIQCSTPAHTSPQGINFSREDALLIFRSRKTEEENALKNEKISMVVTEELKVMFYVWFIHKGVVQHY